MEFLLNHYKTYEKLEISDVFKFVYQSVFGCGHIVSSPEMAEKYIKSEYQSKAHHESNSDALCEDYQRVNMGVISEGLSIQTFTKLVVLSASYSDESGKTQKDLEQKLGEVLKLIKQKKLPFEEQDFLKEWNLWKENGYPPVHHSEGFKKEYNPCYRVMSQKFVPFLPFFAQIDKALERGEVVLAIEGGSASGKTTLGSILNEVYDLTLLHTDDFFLTPKQRTEERLAEVGGNLDRERFLGEILIPLSKKQAIEYKRYDCGTGKILPPVQKPYKKLTVIEGAYSMHIEFEKFYNLSAFLDIENDLQRQRIEKRNSPQMAKRFFEEWIPLEKMYFEKTNAKQRCDLIINIKK